MNKCDMNRIESTENACHSARYVSLSYILFYVHSWLKSEMIYVKLSNDAWQIETIYVKSWHSQTA